MTIFCGAYSLDPRHALPDDLLAQLRRHVSRASGDQPTEYRSGRAYLAQVDIGAFAGEGMLRDAHGSCTIVAGEPLLIDGDNDPEWNRNRDLALLHPAFGADDPYAALRRAAGDAGIILPRRDVDDGHPSPNPTDIGSRHHVPQAYGGQKLHVQADEPG